MLSSCSSDEPSESSSGEDFDQDVAQQSFGCQERDQRQRDAGHQNVELQLVRQAEKLGLSLQEAILGGVDVLQKPDGLL